MYIPFTQSHMQTQLPEKRPDTIFQIPDLFLVFGGVPRVVFWGELLNKIDPRWLEGVNCWDSDFEFGDDPDDFDNQFDDYHTLELMDFPTITSVQLIETTQLPDTAFIWDDADNLYIHAEFAKHLVASGAQQIWYNTTAPFGRY